MRLLIFSDIHGDARALDALMDTSADYYFAAGDLATWSRGLEKLGPRMKTKADRLYVLPGNHESVADIAAFCREFGFQEFHGKTLDFDGWHIGGLGYSSPTPFNTPGEYSETEMASRLEAFAGLKPLVMVCHCPPRDTALDQIRPGLHAGSTAVRRFIEQEQPAWFFCGHIHEAEGAAIQIGETRCVNAGKRGYILEL